MKLKRVDFNTCALVSFRFTGWSLHLGVYPSDQEIYKLYNGEYVYRHPRWIWGRAYEPYDFALDYWGAGPLFLVCW